MVMLVKSNERSRGTFLYRGYQVRKVYVKIKFKKARSTFCENWSKQYKF